jgi:hypothetical protein
MLNPPFFPYKNLDLFPASRQKTPVIPDGIQNCPLLSDHCLTVKKNRVRSRAGFPYMPHRDGATGWPFASFLLLILTLWEHILPKRHFLSNGPAFSASQD